MFLHRSPHFVRRYSTPYNSCFSQQKFRYQHYIYEEQPIYEAPSHSSNNHCFNPSESYPANISYNNDVTDKIDDILNRLNKMEHVINNNMNINKRKYHEIESQSNEDHEYVNNRDHDNIY